MKTRMLALALLVGLATTGCEGPTGPAGAPGADGANGTNGTNGKDGTSGTSCHLATNPDGSYTIACGDGTSVTVPNDTAATGAAITSFHGTDFLRSTGEFAAGKYMAKATITGATADGAGVVTVDFKVADLAGHPVTSVPGVSANVAKLVPPAAGESSSRWVPYVTRIETVTTVGDWPNPVGTTAVQGSAESNGTFTNHGDGTYTYRFAKNLSAVVVDGTPVTYERNRLHRVAVMMGGHTGPTADAVFDFVPDGSAATLSRAIVPTSACRSCHGEDFKAHGGDRLTVETCATCHVPGTFDANGGESLDLKVMIHKIHAGGELPSLAGPDGILWDNPATAVNEAADNGQYAIWGYRNVKHEWWKAEFPAVLANCQKCHQGAGANVDAWKTTPSLAACGSCHDDVNFGTTAVAGKRPHAGGPYADDLSCVGCHPSSGAPQPGVSLPAPVPFVHDWTTKDPRNIPEFDVSLTVSAPANGTHFVAGEAPVVKVVLTDVTTGQPIDHTTVVEDTAATGGAEGCLATGCPPRDGYFATSALFVAGPRAHRMPVLTTAARAQVLSATTGPWDLTAATGIGLKVDGGQDIVLRNVTGGDFVASGTFTVTFPAGAFAVPSAATADELVAALNGNAAFRYRAIAFNQAGKVGIRSRNLGRAYALQLQAGPAVAAVFGGDTGLKSPVGFYTSNTLARRVNPANEDPKVVRTADAITYTLDPVDDLTPGTYIASVEIADRGRVDANNYKTPSVAKVAFQVKTATAEKPPAGNCNSCHQGPDGKGFVLDYSRHNKIFSADAVDQCGGCHDYQSQVLTDAGWAGGRPISKRVHAVHFGSSLFTPLATVDYSNGDPVAGRNWNITFPQDVRNCQACHPDGTTSGSWKTQAARLPCMGCHDSDAAKAHMKLQTWDPTPAAPWSGDEEESCKACH